MKFLLKSRPQRFILETMAGKGSEVGRSFEERSCHSGLVKRIINGNLSGHLSCVGRRL